MTKIEEGELTDQDDLEFFEYVGSIVWFLLDGLWMLAWQTAATLMVIPVLVLNFAIFFYTPRTFFQMAVTVAMNSWLCMNICWMLSDFHGNDGLSLTARYLLLLGVAALATAFIRGLRNPQALRKALSRFRRFRIGSLFR